MPPVSFPLLLSLGGFINADAPFWMYFLRCTVEELTHASAESFPDAISRVGSHWISRGNGVFCTSPTAALGIIRSEYRILPSAIFPDAPFHSRCPPAPAAMIAPSLRITIPASFFPDHRCGETRSAGRRGGMSRMQESISYAGHRVGPVGL